MKRAYQFLIGTGILIALAILSLLVPLNWSLKNGSASEYYSYAHVLMLSFNAYAQDHGGKYPDGKSSTEVFQQLLDQGYLPDAKLLFVNYPALSDRAPATGKFLGSKNVCWDVTAGVDASSPDDLPVIFFTGYKVTYQAGQAATAINRTWLQWWSGLFGCETVATIGYKGCTSRTVTALNDGSIPNFIPADFDPKGKTYRQLTP